MEHAEALERIEIAAAEPDGLERLMAGDTADAAAVAGHLAGCQACVVELARIGRISTLARDAVLSLPDPDLKARTLAFVREVGRDRSVPPAPPSRGPARRLPLVAGLVAAALVAGLAGFAAGGALRAPVSDPPSQVAVLADAAATALRIGGRPDAVHVTLVPTPGSSAGAATASLILSPSDGELVMIATGLALAADGAEYGCWIEVAGERRRIGELYPGGDLQAWSGAVAGLDVLPPDAVFGVSIVPAGGGEPQVILTGSLAG